MERPTHRGRHRVDVENAIIRRREKQLNYDSLWNGTRQYFQHWEKANSKFEQWTSPRYYEDNNKLLHGLKEKKEKEASLERRREKLRKLFEEEQKSYEIEIMVNKNKILPQNSPRIRSEDIPTEILKEVNVGLKEREEERRRHEAEMKLYHQWRINNPVVKQYESKFRNRDLKFSWLDQQIEKRMQLEKEEEENRRILKERDEQIKKEKEKEEAFKKYLAEKRNHLKKDLDEQIEELKRKELLAEELKRDEQKDIEKQNLLADMEKKKLMEEKERAEKECALFNIQQYKMKLKQKAINIQENLKHDELIILKLKESELENMIADETKKTELKQGLNDFLSIIKEQKELEKHKQRHMEFIFDSEAQALYNSQQQIWNRDENARKELFKYIMETVKKQIEDNLHRNHENQRRILTEREDLANKIEDYQKELQKLKQEEDLKKNQNKKQIHDDVKVKDAKKKLQENIKLKEINEELDRIRKEEERLKNEILRIQQNQRGRRYSRSGRL